LTEQGVGVLAESYLCAVAAWFALLLAALYFPIAFHSWTAVAGRSLCTRVAEIFYSRLKQSLHSIGNNKGA
jgi:hypothetical protein